MPNQHKTKMIGWHPPPDLAAWIRAQAARRGVEMGTILREALEDYRAKHDPDTKPEEGEQR